MRVVEVAVPEEGPLWVDRKESACEVGEPRSVLDHRRSPSSPTSTSTLSSEIVGVASRQWPQVAGEDDGLTAELRPIPAGLEVVDAGEDDFEAAAAKAVTMFSDPEMSPEQDQTFFRWIMGDVEDPSPNVFNSDDFGLAGGPTFFDHGDSASGVVPSLSHELGFPLFAAAGPNSPATAALPPSFVNPSISPNVQPNSEILFPNLLQTVPAQNSPFFFSPSTFTAARYNHHHSKTQPPLTSGGTTGSPDLFIRRNYPPPPPLDNSSQQRPTKSRPPDIDEVVVDNLFKAAEMVEAADFGGALAILARLNHQLPSPVGKPVLRSAFYLKETLHCLLCRPPSSSLRPVANPLDVLLKLSAYKAFSDISPVLQFINFTVVQTILEELGSSTRIHIIDFDIGIGSQWSSFMQELAQRHPSSTSLLKITVFVDPEAHHPLELHLTRENLTQFASDLSIPFEFEVWSLNSFNPPAVLSATQSGEAIAVNISLNSPVFSLSTIRLVKHLSPKLVVCVDHGGGDRSNLTLSHHLMLSLKSSILLLDSIEAAGAAPDMSSKIERFLLHPRIENSVLGHCRGAEKSPPWRAVFASSGFASMQFSNFTEIQAECLLKRVQVRGFNINKRQESLVLYWQRGELASVSAWRCS